jgi:hypothetical protein
VRVEAYSFSSREAAEQTAERLVGDGLDARVQSHDGIEGRMVELEIWDGPSYPGGRSQGEVPVLSTLRYR